MRPYPEEQLVLPDLRVLDGVATWCGGLHGAMPLGDALKSLAIGLGASAAAISRHHHRTEEQPRLVCGFSDGFRVALQESYCGAVLDYQFGRAKAGSLWFLGEMAEDPLWNETRALDHWVCANRVAEIAVIPMSVTRQSVDYIEFHFDEPLTRERQAEIAALVPTIERSWNGRKPGLVARTMTDGRALLAHNSADSVRPRWDAPILGMSNPAGLSRAEFRVCLLLSRGLSVKGVSEELGLSENTVRSHLRSIYGKTETSSLSELIYLIMSVAEKDDFQTYGAHRA